MNTLSNFFQSIPFFHSVLFGILSMIIVGASWCLVGLVMGDAPKKKIDPSLVLLLGGWVSIIASLLILLGTTGFPHGSPKVIFLTCASFFLSGAVNCAMLQVMSYAMQRGPNGIIWSIIQSSPMIFPFFTSVLFFNEPLSIFRSTGLLLLLTALAGFGMAKDNSVAEKKPGSWRIPTLICVLLCAINGNLVIIPAYFQEARVVSSIMRSLMGACGSMTAAGVVALLHRNTQTMQNLKASIRSPLLWKYVGSLQFFSLLFAYTLYYPGMNVMADHGYGGLIYPMLVGSCIVSFTLCSIFWLKEKTPALQWISLLICIAGLVMICF